MPNFENNIRDLIIDYLSSNLSTSTKEYVDQWIKESEKNKNTFEEIKSIWNKKAGKGLNRKLSWNKLLRRMKQREPKPILVKPNFTKYAAIIMLLIGIVGYLFVPNTTTFATITTDKNYFTDTLQNGTVVYLYPSSELIQMKSNKTNDEYLLKGEAFFVIPIKTDKDIYIFMGDAKVKVAGTSFRANSCINNIDVSITVESGNVELTNKNKPKEPLQINAGEQGYYSCNNQNIWKHKNSNNIYLIYQPEI